MSFLPFINYDVLATEDFVPYNESIEPVANEEAAQHVMQVTKEEERPNASEQILW